MAIELIKECLKFYKFEPTSKFTLRKLSIFILLLLIAEALSAQPYYFRRYQVEDGLSNNAVLCALQDKNGFMWFGTKDGLNRFDGYSFKVYRFDADDNKTIGGSSIQCLAEDKNGLLWAGTENGIYSYDSANETFTPLENDPHKLIRSILFDTHDNLWFISRLGLFKYNLKTKKIKEYPPSEYFYVSAFCETPNQELWFATPDGFVAQYNTVSNTFTTHPIFDKSPPTSSKWVENIYQTSDGHILIGTSAQGVKHFDTKTHTYKDLLSHSTDKSSIYARNFIKLDDNKYWIGTESGIYSYDLKTGASVNLKKQYNDPYSLSDNAIYAFCKDREGGIWVCTYFGGINYYPRQYATFEKFFHKVGENSISGNAVREITPDQNGNLWIGTEDAGLNKLSLSTGTVSNFKPSGLKTDISHSNLHGLISDGNELWIGTFEHGLDVMDLRTEKVIRHYGISRKPNQLRSNFIYAFYKTRAGQLLLSTTSGLYIYNRQADNFRNFPYVPDYMFYTSIMEDNAGTIWVGTVRDGIFYYNPKTRKGGFYKNETDNKNSLIDNRINRILQDHEHHIWIATEAGLSRLNTKSGKFTSYSIKNGFPSNVIYGLLEDKQNNLWISSSKGLLRFNPKTGNLKTYTKSDGLLSDQFNYNSSYKDPEGNMYFGSVKGLIKFNPANFKTDTFKPPVFITGLQINNQEAGIGAKNSPLKKSVLTTYKIRLNHTQSTFSIDFAALSYTSPVMTEYAYKMDGIDKDWTYLKQNRKAYFTDLSAGHYTFRVKASNSSGVWNTKETILQIEILPAWWASNLAFVVYGLGTALIIFILVKRDHGRIDRKNARRMEVFENEKEKEISHAKIEFFTNVAHEIRTPLTLIKGPMEKLIKRSAEIPDIEKNLKVMNKNTDRLLELTNQLLDFRKTETSGFSLNFVKTNICETLKDITLNFQVIAEQRQISYEIRLPEENLFAYIDLEAFHKIISNLTDNAIKYGRSGITIELLSQTSANEFMTIKVTSDGKTIPHEIHEKIFQPFYRAKEAEIKPGTGIGLSLSRSLAELHNGSLTLEKSSEGFNIFVLRLPIHQLIEFNLNSKWKKI
ncbi:MAG TPA: two-component regulator propeller domain-containing protein [Pedobacter sp.]|nr:two-component regulator propeller domain-containing protein [Pedobacter sp.]